MILLRNVVIGLLFLLSSAAFAQSPPEMPGWKTGEAKGQVQFYYCQKACPNGTYASYQPLPANEVPRNLAEFVSIRRRVIEVVQNRLQQKVGIGQAHEKNADGLRSFWMEWSYKRADGTTLHNASGMVTGAQGTIDLIVTSPSAGAASRGFQQLAPRLRPLLGGTSV